MPPAIAGARFPAYHSLNLRADRRFTLRRSSVIAYISVWNAYDRANVASYYWNTETRRRRRHAPVANAADLRHRVGLLSEGARDELYLA
jgi:hypothetical protein